LLEACQGSPGGDEGFLGAVLGRFALPGQAQAQAVDSRCKVPVQVLEGDEVAARRSGNEVGRLNGGVHPSGKLPHLSRPHAGSPIAFVYTIRDERDPEGLKPSSGNADIDCARIRARGFPLLDALTITSMLPGIAGYYPDPHVATE
jgi:hypothetical protein